MRKINTLKKIQLHKQILSEVTKLATSGFGLVAALAWNELIKELVNQYIKPIVGGASGIISLLIYSLIVTTLAVIVAIYLAKITNRGN